MRFEHWIIITGPTIVLLIALLAIAPDEYWDIEHSTAAVSQGAVAGGAPDITIQSQTTRQQDEGGILNMIPYLNPARSNARPDASIFKIARRQTVKPQPGLMNFEQAPRVRFSGRVQQVSEFQKRDGQIHIWVHDANGREKEISVGPSWFLKYIGCEIGHDVKVKGIGFYFDNVGHDPMIYARKIRVNGKVCRLRNDEGFALWSNRLR